MAHDKFAYEVGVDYGAATDSRVQGATGNPVVLREPGVDPHGKEGSYEPGGNDKGGSMTFIASNGSEVYERAGRVWVDSVGFPVPAIDAIVEYARHEDDKRKGWRRSKINPDVVIMDTRKGLFRILDTRTAPSELTWAVRNTGYDLYAQVIEEYLADQKPTPQPGEVWLLQIRGEGEVAALCDSDGGFLTHTNTLTIDSPDIENARRIYPPKE